MYTPLKALLGGGPPRVPYAPLRCRHCNGVVSPHSRVDFVRKSWLCAFCHANNNFPPHYSGMSESCLPAELFPGNQVIEYQLSTASTSAGAGAGAGGIHSTSSNGNSSHSPSSPFSYLFVVDLVLQEMDLKSSLKALRHALELIPANSRVGLITFGDMIQVYELGFAACEKHYLLRGDDKTVHTKDSVSHLLDLGVKQHQHGRQQQRHPRDRVNGVGHSREAQPAADEDEDSARASTPTERFLPLLSDCDFTLESIVEDLANSTSEGLGLGTETGMGMGSGNRPLRCTGSAVSVAVAMSELCAPLGCCKIVIFAGGACTVGPGKVVEPTLKCHYRTHLDFEKGFGPAIQRFQQASKHYAALGERLTRAGNSVDLFACSLDQVGAAEMSQMVEPTGGAIVLSESFDHHVFRESLKKTCASSSSSSTPASTSTSTDEAGDVRNVLIQVNCSQEIKISGLIGAALGVEPKETGDDSSPASFSLNLVSDVEIGEGRTTQWKTGSANKHSTYAIYFDIVMQHTTNPNQLNSQSHHPNGPGSQREFYIQYVAEYTSPLGERLMRVATVSRPWAVPDSPSIALGFDQEAAAVLMARMATSRTEEGQDIIDTIRWLDRMLVTLSGKYGSCSGSGSSGAFHLPKHFQQYPELMYHLRRSQVLQVFNNSPDETVFFRLQLKKENTFNSLLIIQPTLYSYSFENELRPEPVVLDATSVAPDKVLVMDTFFVVLVHYGSTIVQWRKEGYQDKEEYAGFKALLAAPISDAKALAGTRLPYPKIVECNQNGSQARFLLAKLNPSVTYASAGQVLGGEAIRTDDVSMQTFLDHLGRLVGAQQRQA